MEWTISNRLLATEQSGEWIYNCASILNAKSKVLNKNFEYGCDHIEFEANRKHGMKKSVKYTKVSNEFHIENIGKIFEECETTLRSDVDKLCIDKFKNIFIPENP